MPKLTIERNTTIIGKRNASQPFKAVLDGLVLAYGKTKTEAHDTAMSILLGTYKHASVTATCVQIAKDGSVFIGRIENDETCSVWRYVPDPNNPGGPMIGTSGSTGCLPSGSFRTYFAQYVANYNEVV